MAILFFVCECYNRMCEKLEFVHEFQCYREIESTHEFEGYMGICIGRRVVRKVSHQCFLLKVVSLLLLMYVPTKINSKKY